MSRYTHVIRSSPYFEKRKLPRGENVFSVEFDLMAHPAKFKFHYFNRFLSFKRQNLLKFNSVNLTIQC